MSCLHRKSLFLNNKRYSVQCPHNTQYSNNNNINQCPSNVFEGSILTYMYLYIHIVNEMFISLTNHKSDETNLVFIVYNDLLSFFQFRIFLFMRLFSSKECNQMICLMHLFHIMPVSAKFIYSYKYILRMNLGRDVFKIENV